MHLFRLKNNDIFLSLTALFLVSGILSLALDNYYLLLIPFAVLLFLSSLDGLEVLFLLLLFLTPFSIELKVTKSLSTDFPDEILMWFITAITWLVLLLRCKFQELFKYRNKIFLALSSMLIWSLVTTLFSSHPLVSFKYLLSKFWYLTTFFLLPILLLHRTLHIKRLAQIFVTGMLAIVAYSSFQQFQLDFSFLQVNETVRPFFRNHVNYSASLACIIPILILGTVHSKYKNKRLLLGLLVLICLLNLIFSYSRGAWLGLLFCVVFYFLLRKKLLRISLIVSFITMVAFLFMFINTGWYHKLEPSKAETVYHTDFSEHIAATYELKDMSFAERLYRWTAGVRMTAARPVLGFGPNTFFYKYKAYTLHEFETWVSANKEKSSLHNYYLLQFAEQGIIGGGLFLFLIFIAFSKIETLYHKLEYHYKKYLIGIGCMLTVICIELSVNDLVETDKIGSLFYLSLATIVIFERQLLNVKKGDEIIRS